MNLSLEPGVEEIVVPRSSRRPLLARLQIRVTGAVQGVGFRPFVFRLATALALRGWVQNDPRGVTIEVEGPAATLEYFMHRLGHEAPPGTYLETCETVWLDPVGHSEFTIQPSDSEDRPITWIRPDSATCPDCRRELFDPANRRFRYPFTNCTHCGPRYSIISRLPYDRANTSMAGFEMCPECEAEYRDPASRRFHAQPNACPKCGPQLELWDSAGRRLAQVEEALAATVDAIWRGRIVAVKGLGGFHLIVRAADAEAVARLRERKHREEKPFALMFPGLGAVRSVCECCAAERRILESPEAPIVLLRLRARQGDAEPMAVAPNVAPGQPTLGVMLPYTPLHHLLLHDLGEPIVATSGNRSDEPICVDEHEALDRLAGIAELFLVHNRPILRHMDDSIVRVMAGREMVLRRARGFAPLPVPLGVGAGRVEEVVLAVGAHLKSSVALGIGPNVFISQHLGDLETAEAQAAFGRTVHDLQTLYQARPAIVAADLHPDYVSTRHARSLGIACEPVQHHLAHVAAVMAENELTGPVLGVAWDGTGLGDDGTIWGGEFLRVEGADFERVAHLRPFPLPGGDSAAREPRRAAFGLLTEGWGDPAQRFGSIPTLTAFTARDVEILVAMVGRGIHSPRTSSVGRLFDAVASITGLRQRSHFEGQAAMALEAAIECGPAGEAPYPMPLRPGPRSGAPAQLDWAPTVEGILEDIAAGIVLGQIARRFHDALVEAVVNVARRVGELSVALGGGCFQNAYLLENCRRRLVEEGFRVYWPQRVPPNDGGISLGQVAIARWRRRSLGASLAGRSISEAPAHEGCAVSCV